MHILLLYFSALVQRFRVLKAWSIQTWHRSVISAIAQREAVFIGSRNHMKRVLKEFVSSTRYLRSKKIISRDVATGFEKWHSMKKLAGCMASILANVMSRRQNMSEISSALDHFKSKRLRWGILNWIGNLRVLKSSAKIMTIATAYNEFRNLTLAINSLRVKTTANSLKLGIARHRHYLLTSCLDLWRRLVPSHNSLKTYNRVAQAHCLRKTVVRLSHRPRLVRDSELLMRRSTRHLMKSIWAKLRKTVDEIKWRLECYLSAELGYTLKVKSLFMVKLWQAKRRRLQRHSIVKFALHSRSYRRWLKRHTSVCQARVDEQRARLRWAIRAAARAMLLWVRRARRRIVVRRCFRVFRKLHPVPHCSSVRAVLMGTLPKHFLLLYQIFSFF